MNEAFSIQGYSASGQIFCVVDGPDIYQTDYTGAKRLIGKTEVAYSELEQTTIEYYNKLVELGVIVPPMEPEQMMSQMQQSMLQMAEVVKSLSDEIKELKANGSEHHCKCGEPDVSGRKPAGRGGKSPDGPGWDGGLSGGRGRDGKEGGAESSDGK